MTHAETARQKYRHERHTHLWFVECKAHARDQDTKQDESLRDRADRDILTYFAETAVWSCEEYHDEHSEENHSEHSEEYHGTAP